MKSPSWSGNGFAILSLAVFALLSFLVITLSTEKAPSQSHLVTRALRQNTTSSEAQTSSVAIRVPAPLSSAEAVSADSHFTSTNSSSSSSAISAFHSTSSSVSSSSSASSTSSTVVSSTIKSTTTSQQSSSITTVVTSSSSKSSSQTSSSLSSTSTTSITSTTSSKASSFIFQVSIASDKFTSTSSVTLTSFATITSAFSTEAAQTSTAAAQVAAVSTGFWANKSAVGGTFAVVALAVLGIFFGVWTLLVKRRNRYKDDYEERIYERQQEPSLSVHDPPSPDPSTTEFYEPPMDVYNRDVISNPSPQYTIPSIQEYGTPAAQPKSYFSTKPHNSVSNSLNYDELLDPFQAPPPQIVPAITLAPVTQLPPGHPYANSSKLAPVSFRAPVERDVYTPSIDSFYGVKASGKA